MRFQDRIKYEREKFNWSQQELADQVHVTRQAISKWETGKSLPTIETIIQLSDLFDITIDDFLRGDPQLERKLIQDSRKLAYPKLKELFEVILYVNGIAIIFIWLATALNTFAGTSISLVGLPAWAERVPSVLTILGFSGYFIFNRRYEPRINQES